MKHYSKGQALSFKNRNLVSLLELLNIYFFLEEAPNTGVQ